MSLSIDQKPSQSLFEFLKSLFQSIWNFLIGVLIGRPKVAKVTVTVSSPTEPTTEKYTMIQVSLEQKIVVEDDMFPVSLKFNNGGEQLSGEILIDPGEVNYIEFKMDGTPLDEFKNDTEVSVIFNGNLYPKNVDVPFYY